MIWGSPGIGKSSIVAAVAKNAGIGLVDLRLSQLAPTDLRGLPVADKGVSKWFPPEFLPTQGKGILFLDEINMAPPAMQVLPSPGADVEAESPVPVQMWQGRAQSPLVQMWRGEPSPHWCRCGSGEPSPGADVAGVST